MRAAGRSSRLLAAALTGAALSACNPLLLVDEPFESSASRAERAAARSPALVEPPQGARIAAAPSRPQPVVVATLEASPQVIAAREEARTNVEAMAEAMAEIEPTPPAVAASTSLIGPDFLPPEPSPPLATAQAIVPARPVAVALREAGTGDPVGPALTEPARVAIVQLREPSAFDVVIERAPPATLPSTPPSVPAASSTLSRASAPDATRPPAREPMIAPLPSDDLTREAASLGLTIASVMPDPGERDPMVTTSASGYGSFYRFALERLGARPEPGGRRGMLLDSPESIDPELKVCGNLPPAVLVDLDPGAGLLPLAGNDRADPGLVTYLDDLRARGVTVYWISGHGPEAAGRIRTILDATGLDPVGADPIIVTRFAGESKQRRRYALGETNCLLAIVGDQRADFDELYDFVLDPIMAAPLEGLVGEGWFLAPPPVS